MYQIAKLRPYSYRLNELKRSYVVDSYDGTELGWCRSVTVFHCFFLTGECYVELECFKRGTSTVVGYSLDRYYDLEPTAKQYTYRDLIADLHTARRAWLEAPAGLGKRMFDTYQSLARLQPFLLEKDGNWTWSQYSQAIGIHLLGTLDEPLASS